MSEAWGTPTPTPTQDEVGALDSRALAGSVLLRQLQGFNLSWWLVPGVLAWLMRSLLVGTGILSPFLPLGMTGRVLSSPSLENLRRKGDGEMLGNFEMRHLHPGSKDPTALTVDRLFTGTRSAGRLRRKYNFIAAVVEKVAPSVVHLQIFRR